MWHRTALVALHHSRIDITYLAEEVANMGMMYGNCLIVPEVNNCGLALVKYLLDEFQVPVYRRKRMSKVTKMYEQAYGWNTDRSTRKTVIDNLATALLEDEIEIYSEDVLKEMKTFVVNDKGKPTAAPGHHDDHVLAAAIALYNIDAAVSYKEKRRKISQKKILKDPTYLCPDGWSRKQLGELGIGRR
jgi:phage terminase large subunit